MSHVDLDVRVGSVQPLQAFRRGDDGHEFDLFAAVLLDEVDGSHGGSAGGQHGVGDDDGPLIDGIRQLAVVLVGLMGHLVTVEADVPHLCRGNQGQDAVYHAEAGPENGDHRQLLAGDHGRHAGLDGSLHGHVLQGKVPEGLVAHEHGDLLHQRPELVGAGILIPEDGYLVLDQRMVKYGYIFHDRLPFSIWCPV